MCGDYGFYSPHVMSDKTYLLAFDILSDITVDTHLPLSHNKGMTTWNTTEPPKDGREIIVWTSSKRGFKDITCTINYCDDRWIWSCNDDLFKGPIHGWMDYPQPMGDTRPDGTVSNV